MKHALILMMFAGFAFAGTGKIENKNDPERETTWTLEDDGTFSYEGAGSRREWVWDGEVLQPKREHSKHYHFAWDGERFAPKRGDEDHNTVRWDGDELKIDDRDFEPRRFRLKEGEWYPVHGRKSKHTWVVEGDLPIPLAAFVIFDLANADDREEE